MADHDQTAQSNSSIHYQFTIVLLFSKHSLCSMPQTRFVPDRLPKAFQGTASGWYITIFNREGSNYTPATYITHSILVLMGNKPGINPWIQHHSPERPYTRRAATSIGRASPSPPFMEKFLCLSTIVWWWALHRLDCLQYHDIHPLLETPLTLNKSHFFEVHYTNLTCKHYTTILPFLSVAPYWDNGLSQIIPFVVVTLLPGLQPLLWATCKSSTGCRVYIISAWFV